MVDVQNIWRALCVVLLVGTAPGCFSSPTPHPAQDAGIATPPNPDDSDVRDSGNDFGEACSVDGGPADACDPGDGHAADGGADAHGDGMDEADGADTSGEADGGPEP